MDLLSRYLAGEHEAVWRVLTEQPVTDEARAVAHATMRRVRENAELLRATLESRGFDFDAAPREDPARAFVPVGAPVARTVIVEQLEGHGPIPCSLQAFWEVVGHLNFIGALHGEARWPGPEEVDALQIYSPFAYVHDTPSVARKRGGGGASLVARLDALLGGDDDDADEEPDEDPHEDFVITLDGTMKAGFGGVGPILLPRGSVVDAPLVFEDGPVRGADGSPLTFIGYLREGFARGGFFGLSPETHRATIARLTRGLVPF